MDIQQENYKKNTVFFMPSKLIDRSKAKNRGIMPSKLIGPPIIRWKEKKKQKHQYLLYQTKPKHHSHQPIIITLCHHTMTLFVNFISYGNFTRGSR